MGLVGPGSLGQVKKSSNVCLLIGVIKDALGEDSLVVSGVRVGALLELVAIVADERLRVSLKVVDAIADILFPAVGSLASAATIVTTAWADVMDTATSAAEAATRESVAATRESVAATRESEAATRESVAAVILSGHGNNKGCKSSCEFHFIFWISLLIYYKQSSV